MTLSIAPNAALVIVDVQQDFDLADYWGPRNNPDAEQQIAALADAWTTSDRPVVVVQHISPAGEPLALESPGHALKPVVAQVPAALRVTKTVNSAFYGTPDLHAFLQGAGIEQVVVVGIQTNMCVETTARMAGNLGYDVVVPLDATHTFDLAGPDGVVMTADELTRATAVNLHGGEFATVTTTAAVLAALA